MSSFICDVAMALGRGMAAHLRTGANAASLGRGEWLAIATVLEITGARATPGADLPLPEETWARMEALARRDFDLVSNARSKAI